MASTMKTLDDLYARTVLADGPMPTPCRVWNRPLNKNGYGRFRERGEDGVHYVMAHVRAHELRTGRKVPSNMVVDHECRNRACIEHTRLKTPRVNTLIGEGPTAKNARKTHCEKHGCMLVRRRVAPDAFTVKGQRRCPECAREYSRAYKARERAKRVVRELFVEPKVEVRRVS